MKQIIMRLLNEERGALITAEYALIAFISGGVTWAVVKGITTYLEPAATTQNSTITTITGSGY